MWSCEVVISKHVTPFNKAVVPSVSAASLPRRRRNDVSTNGNEQVGELGHTLLATLESNPTPIPKPQQGEISGSDVLWALQRASARKKKKNKIKHEHRRGSSSVPTPTEQTAVDYTNVRPLCINPNWAPKLDELGKRLRDLSLTI
ncbi:hypothetical protein VNO77_18726 [Canavalia gladiata]|uniref:Uncharacterized protein n=1 Tax=Canavalia gladiata TaxID=3824 RepID=A0AAN9LM24_CANGL